MKQIFRSAWIICELMVLAALAGGCSSLNSNNETSSEIAAGAAGKPCTLVSSPFVGTADEHYTIKPGDELLLGFYMSPEFDRDVTVQPDGNIDLEAVGLLPVAGRTPSQVVDEINQAYRRELRDPQATIVVKNSPVRVVYVQGEVGHPGAVPLVPQMTAIGAIAQAGGFTDSAGTSSVILIRRDACGNPQAEKLNLAGATSQKNLEQDAGVMPSDIIVVPKSGIVNLDLFVKQYIRDALPVEPYLSIPVL
ncbi:MAG: polysaccharide biosynthesis/export family protein [Candidatus Binataceae bacterium]|jgi:protein involved in polysaccharide export with SLBB domain